MKTVRKTSIFICAICFFVCMLAALFCSIGTNIAFAAEQEDASISENYDRSSVLVVLSEQATFSFKTYKPSDFNGIGCTDVVELTTESLEVVKQQLKDTDNTNSNGTTGKQLIDVENYRRILELKISSRNSKNLETIVSSLEKRQDISCVSLNYVYENYTETNLEYNSYDTYAVVDMRQWAVDNINLPQAWNITTGSSSVNVGIVDTGIDGTHSVLSQNLNNDLHRDFRNATTTEMATPFDTDHHGTHVAGIVGLKANSAYAKGVCDDVNLIALTVSENGFWYSNNVILAVEYATTHNIQVLNYSGRVRDRAENINVDDPALKQAISQYPGLFVTSAGNDSINIDTGKQYPAKYSTSLSNVITVGSITSSNSRSSFSNYGANTVDIYAPGSDILSSYPISLCQSGGCGSGHYADGYHYLSGTSMAAPYVTGVAALMLSKNPNLTGAQLKRCLVGWADTITISAGGSSQRVKKLNAYNCVKDIQNVDSYHCVFLETTNNPEGTQASKQFLWIKNGDPWPTSVDIPTAPFGYEFKGYFYNVDYSPDTQFAIYWENGNFNKLNYYFKQERFYSNGDITLKSRWMPKPYYFVVAMKHAADWDHPLNIIVTSRNYEESLSHSMAEENTVSGVKKKFTRWDLVILDRTYEFSTDTTLSITVKEIIDKYCPNYDELGQPSIYFYAIYDTNVSSGGGGGKCITPGSLITLADGTTKPVEELTGNEMLLVWDMQAGSFSSAPILFIDSDEASNYQIINLYFSDGTTVEVIDEHAFWNCNLNEYVFLREDAAKYIGHWFEKQTTDDSGKLTRTSVQLSSVEISCEYTTAWSPVTYGHLCYYVNGMLSMPGATQGLINIFEVDATSMSYDKEAYERDIQTYGLYTYEEFCAILPVSEEVFNAFNGQYLKVAIGKNLLTENDIITLYARYSEFLS